MSTEYREHYEWAKKDLYTRDGKSIGRHYPEPVNYLAAIEGWKPRKVVPECEDILAERMKREFGAYKSSLINKKKRMDENVFQTSYQSTFKPEYNYRPSFSTYEKAAKMYAKEVDDEFDDEGTHQEDGKKGVEDIKAESTQMKQVEQEDKLDSRAAFFKNEKMDEQQEILGADELAQAAVEMIQTDFSKGKMWNLCNLPLVDAKERYHRYREYLDKSPSKKYMLNKFYHY